MVAAPKTYLWQGMGNGEWGMGNGEKSATSSLGYF